MYNRLERLIGIDNLKKLMDKKVLIVGLGGVGGTAFEALVRSGIINFIIVDKDRFDISNLNRQILALEKDIGEYKVLVASKRAKNINKNINIEAIQEDINNINLNEYKSVDYIIDACDDIPAKIRLIKFANENNIKIISALGMGKRLEAFKVELTTLDKTKDCPLAKKLRYELRKENISLKIPVVFSSETPVTKDNIVASCMFVPSTAGLYLANYVFLDIINNR